MFFTSQNFSGVYKCLGDLENLKQGFDENRLSVNGSKCELVNCGTFFEETVSKFRCRLQWQNRLKCLGIIIGKNEISIIASIILLTVGTNFPDYFILVDHFFHFLLQTFALVFF